jgi:AraC-like DNA-binding protein
VRFRAAFDRIVFAEDLLSLPFVPRDDGLGALLPDLEALVAPGRSLADEVRMAIACGMCATRPSVDKIARRLHLSARTLQRRLGDEGTSYQELLDDVRRRTARRLLAETDLDPVDVAFLLGFEEPNSFARAFRTWEGTTALRWRSVEAR